MDLRALERLYRCSPTFSGTELLHEHYDVVTGDTHAARAALFRREARREARHAPRSCPVLAQSKRAP